MRIEILFRSLLVLFSAAGMTAVNAATIGLSSGPLPDLTTSNANFNYTYTQAQCLDAGGSGESGDCGTTVGLDTNKPNDDRDFSGPETVAGGGQLLITGSNMVIEADEFSGIWLIENGSYNVTANFDASGVITDASVSVYGNVNQFGGTDPGNDFQSGTLALSADLLDFGFQGNGTTGTFEFIFQPATGDMVDYVGGNTINIIASGVNTFSQLAGFSGVNGWDPTETNDPAIFLQSFSGTGSVDTFVPVPAAAWLFLSALVPLGLFRSKS